MLVQSAVYDVVQALQIASLPGLPSLVVADLADYATLAYYAGFTVESSKSASALKQVTYIALSKKAMPRVVELFDTFKTESQLYSDGTIEHVLSVRSFGRNTRRVLIFGL